MKLYILQNDVLSTASMNGKKIQSNQAKFVWILKLDLTWQPVKKEGGGSNTTKSAPRPAVRLGYPLTHSSSDKLSLQMHC